jgi:carnitine O-palmitoyltransferase 1
MIDKALFMVILDDAAPDTLSEVGKQSLHGKGWNRWFDKSINLIFYANGKVCAPVALTLQGVCAMA